MSRAQIRVFSRARGEEEAATLQIVPNDWNAVYVRVKHPQGASRLIGILLGPRGGIDIVPGFKNPH